jgi:hypothetical protein
MPKKSERLSLIRDLNVLLKDLYLDGKEDSADFIELYEILVGVESCRNLISNVLIPKNNSHNAML